MNVKSLKLGDSNYPKLLEQIYDPPKKIYYRGDIQGDELAIAIVGSRKMTKYGRSITYKLAYDLAAEGVVIVSGLALGIDAVAHRAALDAGGKTIAVLGNGVDKIHPTTNHSLGESILENNGALVSEYSPGTPPMKHHYPERNRIVAGIAKATLVTEAAKASGSLITARLTLEENKPVLAVPGNLGSPNSIGTNNLIKSGAHLVQSANDILEIIGYERKAELLPKGSNKYEDIILDLISKGIHDIDDLSLKSKMDSKTLNQTLSMLEITGKIKSTGGGQWSL